MIRRIRPLLLACGLAGGVCAALPAATQTFDLGGDLTEGGKSIIVADEVVYDSRAREVTALGNVEVVYRGRRLRAQELTYNEATGEVRASGDVSLTDELGNVAFGSSVVLSGDLADGVIEDVSARLARGETKIAAARATREGGTLSTLEKATYSPCKVCEGGGAPLWQIRASRLEHDQKEKVLRYQDPTFEVFGVPVAYLPYFELPDPTVRRASGFLAPRLFESSLIGYGVEVPYFFALAPDRDLTFSPLLLSEEWPLFNLEYRALTETGGYTFNTSFAYTTSFRETGSANESEELRGAIFGQGAFAIDGKTKWGFNLERTTDDTFLRRYEIDYRDRLQSELYAERIDDRDYAGIRGFLFQGLRAEDDPGETPVVLPFAEYSGIFADAPLGGVARLDLSALALTRTDGIDTRRLTSDAQWYRRLTSVDGHLFTLFGGVRADLYHSSGGTDPGNPGRTIESGMTGRFVPYAGGEWSWPLLRDGQSMDQLLEPIVQFVVSPYGNNPDDIPNEDSASFEFDETNLFSINKFPGEDRLESGPRFNYGVRYFVESERGWEAEAVVGQSYRFRDDSTFDVGSGLENQRSDYVGRLGFSFGELFEIHHRFRLDVDDLSYRRAELGLSAGWRNWRGALDYVRIDDQGAGATGRREEILLESSLRLTENWSIRGDWRRDLEADEDIEARAGLTYQDECFFIDFLFKRRFTRDRDLEPSTSIGVRIRLLTLG